MLTCRSVTVSDHSWFGIHWEVIVVVAHVVQKMRLDGTFCPTVEISSFQHALLAFSQLHTSKCKHLIGSRKKVQKNE